MTSDSNDIRISFAGQAGSIIFDGQWWNDAGIEKIQFADGTTWSLSDIAAHYIADQQTADNDTIWGTPYNDTVIAGDGNDTMKMGAGNDVLEGGAGNDTLLGEAGIDAAVYAGAASGVSVNLAVTTAQDTVGAGIDTLSGIENLKGSAFNDVLAGNSSANTIEGGAGSDVLNGGAGNDILIGGADEDSFLFSTALSGTGNVDQIIDFMPGNDRIDLSQLIFSALGPSGTLDASAFQAGTAANDAQDRIIYDPSSGKLYYDADGNGAGAQVLFAQVTAGLPLVHSDFVVI